jgi:hypothetical protein
MHEESIKMSCRARIIRKAVSAALAACCLLAPLLGAHVALAGIERPHCEICGRYIDKSPSRIRATERIGKHGLEINVCSVFCYAERLEDLKGEIISAQVVDSTTLEDEAPVMLSTGKAAYLYGTSGDAEKTAEPFILAFASKQAAESARKTTGGELLNWDDVLAKCQKLAADYEPPQPDGSNAPLRKRGRTPR